MRAGRPVPAMTLCSRASDTLLLRFRAAMGKPNYLPEVVSPRVSRCVATPCIALAKLCCRRTLHHSLVKDPLRLTAISTTPPPANQLRPRARPSSCVESVQGPYRYPFGRFALFAAMGVLNHDSMSMSIMIHFGQQKTRTRRVGVLVLGGSALE